MIPTTLDMVVIVMTLHVAHLTGLVVAKFALKLVVNVRIEHKIDPTSMPIKLVFCQLPSIISAVTALFTIHCSHFTPGHHLLALVVSQHEVVSEQGLVSTGE